MANKLRKKAVKLTDAELGFTLGITRQAATKLRAKGLPNHSIEEARGWYEANVNTGQDEGTRESLVEMRCKLLKAQEIGETLKNRLREYEVQEAEARLIPEAVAQEAIELAVGPVVRALANMADQLKVKCNPGDPELAGGALTEWARRLQSQCERALRRAAEEKRSQAG